MQSWSGQRAAGIASLQFQMWNGGVEHCADGVLCQSVRPVCELEWVKCGRETGCNVSTDQFLKTLLHGHRCQNNWSVVVKTADSDLFGQRDDCGRLQAWWDEGLGQWLAEDPGEESDTDLSHYDFVFLSSHYRAISLLILCVLKFIMTTNLDIWL